MRSVEEITHLILDTAHSDKRIRAVLLNGSRANDKITPDPYQDFDIVYVVDELESFTSDHSWTDVFGKKILWQMPDAMILGFEEERDAFTYLMVFEDGNRIDLTLFPKNKLSTSFEQDSLTKVWLDKDQLFADLEAASDKDYLIKRPSEKLFQDICNEFWWVSPYVAKAIARGEILHAKEEMELPVRKTFHRIIAIYIGIHTDFSVSFGKGGRFAKKYLPESEYEKILLTYADHKSEHIIHSMHIMMDVFSHYAQKIAQELHYSYNLEEELNSRTYFQSLIQTG